ncbi:molybdopterin-binding protein, partial [Salmonella enterica subsp. enterica serovar Give]|nr:molybdopterin-binding protein [Salmonella enterica]EBU7374700.1 molybdopterin-binding protein [Salmonella enterica subsp. enterica serovar Give]EBX2803884.1 molybdopterin-binding protein [Salmonella enterica subsp. enterica serovar Braenderup]ECB2440219.1 molybdopterin-binding protein [Salmonella enterica subsp. enterica serovar Enteritidis]EDC7370675.1 molybdopterin-binding protein [Salmonella enterica subsp. enterica serovar Typhimurium]
MKTELNVANSLVLNRLAGRSKNNNEIVPGFNKKTTVLASAI